MPSDLICNEAFFMSGMNIEDLKNRLGITIYSLDPWYFDDAICQDTLKEHFKVGSLTGLGLADYDCGIIASGAFDLSERDSEDISFPYVAFDSIMPPENIMLLDSSTRRNLELCETLREKQKRGSLLWVLDKTKTAMGARNLRKYIEQPLVQKYDIEKRLDALNELLDNAISREEIREYLSPIYDLERLVSKITYQSANPRDMIAFEVLFLCCHISNIF